LLLKKAEYRLRRQQAGSPQPYRSQPGRDSGNQLNIPAAIMSLALPP